MTLPSQLSARAALRAATVLLIVAPVLTATKTGILRAGSLDIGALSLCGAGLPACSRASARRATVNSLHTIIDDMSLPHEGRPHGVPDSYDWARGPAMGLGNHPPADWRAFMAWGQLYEDARGNPARNARVEIRRMRAYILSRRDGRWRRVQASEGVEGAAYREDFAGDLNTAADLRQEPDGGVSVTAGGGHNFHFWPAGGRTSIRPEDVAGVFVTVEARLVVARPNQPDDRRQARYLLSVGADYWVNRTASWDHFKTNDGVGVGRFKYVTPQWQAFNFATLTADELRRNPPPLE